MRIAYDNIRSAIQAVLAKRPFSLPDVHLMPIEPPRDWGVSTNICFLLGPQAARDTIELETEGLGKKEAKQAAQRLAREGGEWLAKHLVEELAQQAGTDALPYVARVEAEGAYVNFYYDVARLTAHVVETINSAPVGRTSASASEAAASLPPEEGIGKREEGRDIGSRGLQSPGIASSAAVPAASGGENVQGRRDEGDGGAGGSARDSGGLRTSDSGPPPDDADTAPPVGRASLPAIEQARPVGQASLPATLLTDPHTFGHGAPTGKRIMVEYAQPNTHKDFHVGHLRNASIGQAIANLQEFAGNDVLKATYIGDIGLHVAKAIFGNKHRFDSEYKAYYVEANRLSSSDDRLAYWGACYKGTEALLAAEDERAKEEHGPAGISGLKVHLLQWLGQWQAQVEGEYSQWQLSRGECVGNFRSILDELHLRFDTEYWFYESTVDELLLGYKTADELKQLGIAEIDESDEYKGALYVDFEKHADAMKDSGHGGPPHQPVFRDDEKKRIRKLGKMTILRSDGTSLYQTKELGLAKYKFDLVREKYGADLDESLYVVGAEQNLYFQQVFAILRLWGFPNAENCKHISYELVTLPEGKMSSREGTIVSYRELRDEAVRRAEQIARDKGIGAKDASGAIDEVKVKAIAHDVAIAAIKFAMLKVTGSQQIVFDFEEALSFSGRSAPYLQYAYARAGKLVADVGATHDNSAGMEDSGAGVPARHSIQAQQEGLQRYRHRLPHWRLPGAVYFITWRMGPKQAILTEAERQLVADAILHFDEERYLLHAYVVMDDHVHVLAEPKAEFELESIIHSWKSFTANRMQRNFGRKGSIWQDEYLDRIVRDEDEYWQKAEYIVNNPLKRWPELKDYHWCDYLMAGRDARPTKESPLQDTHPTENHIPHPSEAALARLLSTFPTVCREASAKYEPATICTFLYDLATAFSDFYRDCRVLDAPEPERTFRRALTTAFRRVLRTGFKLLALPLPEEM